MNANHIVIFLISEEILKVGLPPPLPRVFHVGGIVTVPQSYSRRFENFDLLVTFGYFEKECVQSILSSSESISLELKVLNAN